jgi:hypothetical protein
MDKGAQALITVSIDLFQTPEGSPLYLLQQLLEPPSKASVLDTRTFNTTNQML